MSDLTPLEAAKIIEKRMQRYHPTDAITAASKLAVNILRKIASGEYAPVVHAHWVDYVIVTTPKGDKFPTVKCSKCGMIFCDVVNNHHEIYHRCPCCGAVMDERESNNG